MSRFPEPVLFFIDMRKPTALVVAPCSFDADPRHSYWSQSLLENNYQVIELEILSQPRTWRSAGEVSFSNQRISVFSSHPLEPSFGYSELDFPVESTTGAFLRSQFLRCSSSLRLAMTKFDFFENIDVVVANDLTGLIASLNIWDSSSTQIVYDAQEIFTDSYDLLGGEPLSATEKEWLISLESELMQRVEVVVTISPGMADLYRRRHQVESIVVPNFAPRRLFTTDISENSGEPLPVRFVYVGRAEPHRGLENLLASWDVDEKVAVLDLFIPQSRHRTKLLKMNRNLKKRRKFASPMFLDSVEPHEIVTTLSNYHVGILPYNYPAPYDQASPNKLGEYIAAGLCVIANDQDYVTSLINDLNIGLIFSWEKKDSLVETVELIAKQDNRQLFQKNVLVNRHALLSWDIHVNPILKYLSDNCSFKLASFPLIDDFYQVDQKLSIANASKTRLRNALVSLVKANLQILGPLINRFGKYQLFQKMASG